jgi:hypothetical protein
MLDYFSAPDHSKGVFLYVRGNDPPRRFWISQQAIPVICTEMTHS